MKLHLTILFFSLSLFSLQAQIEDDFFSPCGTSDPVQPGSEVSQPDVAAPSAVLVIPVVFHVLHQSGVENTSREDLLAILQRLNQDFAKSSPDLPGSPEVFKNQAVDMEVVFKLATIDPNGNCTDGINRVFTERTDLLKYADNPPVHWPTQDYFNIYVCRTFWNDGSLPLSQFGGFATFPSANDPFDGIYITEMSTKVSQQSYPLVAGTLSTISHETGHWLNLLHIWGNEGPDQCFETDNVSDTPPQNGPSRKCPEDFPYITCNNGPNGNMFCNMMDYGNCLTMFTQGQKTRTQIALSGGNRYQWQANNLIQTGVNAGGPNFTCPVVPNADFAFDQYALIKCEPDISVVLQERCFRAKPSSIEWYLPGGTPAYSTDFDVTVQYPAAGEYSVTMIAKNFYGSDTVTRTILVQTIPETSYAAGSNGETFENATDITDAGAVYNRLGTVNFMLSTDAGFNSNQSMVFPKTDDYFGAWFVSRKFTTTSEDTLLTFKVAKQPGGSPRLAVRGDIDCAPMYAQWVGIRGFTTATLTSTTDNQTNFYPTGPDDWTTLSMVIPPEGRNRDDLQFTFYYYGEATNNFFIDDIRVTSQLATAVSGPETDAAFELFPNPATDRLEYRFDQPVSGSTLVINDLYGRVRVREMLGAATSGAIELVDLPPGAYWCQLLDEHGRPLEQPKKVIVL